MKLWRKYKGCFLALILVISMIGSGIFVSGAFAEETQDQEAATTETTEAVEEADQDDKATTEAEKTSKIQTQALQEEQQLFSMECEFDGKTLKNDTSNVTDTWKATESKTLKVQITRNKNVNVESGKKYYVCLKLSELFYFNGLPDADKITGVKNVVMVKNDAPDVYNSSGTTSKLPNFSSYSGEIRLEINPSVEVITIPDVGISCNRQLVGYTGTTQEITDHPISMSVIKVDASKDIKSIKDEDKEVINQCEIAKESIQSGSLAGTSLKNTMSTSGFTSDIVNEQDVTIGKDGDISYAGGTAGQNNQVYKELTIEFDCPYIEIENQKYYLKFDENESVLTTNKQGTKQGYKVDSAVYNKTNHTITYTFKNIYLGGHTPVFYTPRFSWPENGLLDKIQKGTKYKIQGASWRITKQTCYTGAKATITNLNTPSKFAYYIADQVDIAMTSSAQASDDEQIAKRYIYKGLTRANKNEGTLGFFDVHNNGSLDSSELKMKFEFNTDETSKATYYVTKVNIPVYDNTSGTEVTYELSNGTETKSGTKKYSNQSSFTCNVQELRTACSADNTYYIKQISYTTKLQKGHKYHAETAHLYRNRYADSGLFFGYIEGAEDSKASAKMTIESTNNESITEDDKTQITSTETSTVSSDDYIGYGLTDMTINGGTSQAITAGGSTKLKFGATLSSEEYPLFGNGKVNGYHVFRDGIIYICLPEGVSIAGNEQVKVTQSGRKIPVKNVAKIENTSCTVNNVKADWWQFEADGINANNSAFYVEVQLSTNNQMQGLVWDFGNCVGIRPKGQSISWNSASSKSNAYRNISEVKKAGSSLIQTLGNTLENNGDSTSVAINFYNSATNVKLNVARAEAKLDVKTTLQTTDSDAKQNIKLTKKDTEINYNISIESTDGGYADDFSYYIPIVSKKSAIDENALVAKKEFNMALQGPITIKSLKTGDEVSGDDSPYIVSYTTDQNLDSTTIRRDDVHWKSASDDIDYNNITAIKIVTKEGKYINHGDSYQFISKLKYTGTDFDQLAGSEVQWKSFGHYTYRRNGETTNTYPSEDNKITIGYEKDFTNSAKDITLGTSDEAENPASITTRFDPTFVKAQTLTIKKVEVSQGTSLISEDPKNLTGTQANNQFKVTCKLNNGTEAILSAGSVNSEKWNISAGTPIDSLIKVYYSKAMTDRVTQRYIKITFGNDDIDMTYQLNLVRQIEPADAKGSGIVEGEVYQVPKIDDDGTKICSISQNSAFTGLYVVNSFVPGNFTSQTITWKKDDVEKKLPSGTTIIMMPISEDNKVTGYWYYKANGSESKIDLNQFVKMSGGSQYSYDTKTSSGTTLRYQFVVDFENAQEETGNYKLAFGAEGTDTFNDVDLPVQIKAKTTYSLKVQDGSNSLSKKVIYKEIRSEGNDSYREGKTLALVITPEDASSLPKDAYISDGEKEYTMTGEGIFIVPIGTIVDDEKTLTLKADMFPAEEQAYKFSVQLHLVNSNEYSKSALNSNAVGEKQELEFTKEKEIKPSLKITGTQVAGISEWSGGQNIQITMNNISDGKQLTVTPYIGLTGAQKASDLLSSVSGIFELQNGSGTYDSSKTPTNKLILNSSVKSGTYRLVFEVKGKDGKTELSVPYYIIVE